jgi:predicted enzyme related to lactoylglutathione lyase
MVTDTAAARQFYSSLFGWHIQDGPPEAGGYLMCMLKGRAAAAISPKPSANPFPNVWSTYLASDDLDSTAAKAKEAGSQFMMEPMNEPGALVWNELMTRDYEGAKAFYPKVFGSAYQEIGEGFAYSTVQRCGDGKVVAGMGELGITTPKKVPAGWVVYFRMEDADASAATAVRLGASILRQPFDTPFGRMSSLIGAQGKAFSLIQAAPEE